MTTINALFFGLLAAAGPASAFVRMNCNGRILRSRVDPIVNPGAVAGHVHTISGGNGFDFSMDFAKARASTCSSCQIKEDMSNYWTPQLYVKKKDGTLQAVPTVGDGDDNQGGMTVYYLQRGAEPKDLKPFPEGFRMLAGDPLKREATSDHASQAVNYACLGANKPETQTIPNYSCPNGLRAQIFFPACWDGKNLDSPDHRSHMAYPTGNAYNNGPCPASHPVHLVSLFFEVLYDTVKFDSEWVDGKHPFVFSNGDASGQGFHGDFVNGWDIPVLDKLIKTCTDPKDQGVPSACRAITLFTDNEMKSCRVEPKINENVDGPLKELPGGCNPITAGPAPAAKMACSAPKIGAFASYFSDVTSSKGWAYEGCYMDGLDGRTMTQQFSDDNNLTVEKCLDQCTAKGFKFAGMEWSKQCFCSNSVAASKASPKGTTMGMCSMKCSGNAQQYCGGSQALSVYRKCSGSECLNNVAIPIADGGNGTVPDAPSTPVIPPAGSSPVVLPQPSKTAVIVEDGPKPGPGSGTGSGSGSSPVESPVPSATASAGAGAGPGGNAPVPVPVPVPTSGGVPVPSPTGKSCHRKHSHKPRGRHARRHAHHGHSH